MPGYSVAKSDADNLNAKYKCAVCELLLRDAMQTGCGHFYCLSCLDSLIVADAHIPTIKCRVDETLLSLEEVFPDNFMRREISQLVVHCTFTEQGCKWKGEVKTLETHTKACEFLHVPCSNRDCGMMVKKSAMKEHVEKECKCRLQQCDYCKKEVKLNLMEIHHNNDCPAYPTICEKCNKGGIPRAKIADHQDPLLGDCDVIRGPCPFSEVGCSEKKLVSRNVREQHQKENVVPHIFLLLKLAMNLSRDVESLMCRNPRLLSRNPGIASDYEKTISDILSQIQGLVKGNKEVRDKLQDQSQRITALERRMAAVSVSAETASVAIRDESGGPRLPANEVTRRVTNLENRTADHEVLLVENNRNTDDLRQQINSLGRQLESAMETIRRLERKVESHEHVLAIRNVALADLEEFVRQQQVSSYDGALLWKIDDYARRKNDAVSGRQTSFYSPCFYTSRHGYKMCSRVYLNGDGMGKGTHISVFFVVMRGQFDGLLRWPFRQKVTIMLLDQDNVEHVIDAFRPDPNSSSFQRPRREMNVASGCPLFCSLAELNKHAYVRDDVMFMKIIVDTSDL